MKTATAWTDNIHWKYRYLISIPSNQIQVRKANISMTLDDWNVLRATHDICVHPNRSNLLIRILKCHVWAFGWNVRIVLEQSCFSRDSTFSRNNDTIKFYIVDTNHCKQDCRQTYWHDRSHTPTRMNQLGRYKIHVLDHSKCALVDQIWIWRIKLL